MKGEADWADEKRDSEQEADIRKKIITDGDRSSECPAEKGGEIHFGNAVVTQQQIV